MYAPSFSDATVCDPNLLAHVVVSQNRAKSIRTRNACARIHAQRTQIVCKVFCIVEALPTSAACPRCFSSTATDIIAAPALHHARRTTKTYTGIITRAKGCKAGAEYLTVSQPRKSSAVHLALWQRSCQLSAVYHYGRLDFGIVANWS